MAILDRSDEGAIAHLTLNSPGNLNALSDAMLAALQSGLDRLARDRTIRVVTLRGTGKAFCAGHDLQLLRQQGPGLHGSAESGSGGYVGAHP